MILHIDYDVDRDCILYESRKAEYEPFVDPKTQNVLEFWKICRDVGPYTQVISDELCRILDVQVKPRYYIQEVGSMIPWHVDRGTKCAVNMVLSTQDDPIEFRHQIGFQHYIRKYHYNFALIDTSMEHRVRANREDRLLFKMSIFDKSFSECKDAYEEYQRQRPQP